MAQQSPVEAKVIFTHLLKIRTIIRGHPLDSQENFILLVELSTRFSDFPLEYRSVSVRT